MRDYVTVHLGCADGFTRKSHRFGYSVLTFIYSFPFAVLLVTMPPLIPEEIQTLLFAAANRYHRPDFILDDPIGIPHRFTNAADIEISGFWVAMLSWGQRKSIIASANRLLERMDNAPYDFITNHTEPDRRRFTDFVHRTFQPLDALFFLERLQQHYRTHDSLETMFLTDPNTYLHDTVEQALVTFHQNFFDHPDAPDRTRKHVATPARGSTCKRLCMFLRWMVRHEPPQTEARVDFGIFKTLRPAQLVLPLDVHVERQARRLGLITRTATDWRTALELTHTLRILDPLDPARFDFALFGLGIEGKRNDFIGG